MLQIDDLASSLLINYWSLMDPGDETSFPRVIQTRKIDVGRIDKKLFLGLRKPLSSIGIVVIIKLCEMHSYQHANIRGRKDCTLEK